MHQRPALRAGEHHRVELLFQLRVGAAQDDATARAAQRLVRGAGDHIGIGQRIGRQAGGHQACDVRHVDQQVGTDLIGDSAEARVIEVP